MWSKPRTAVVDIGRQVEQISEFAISWCCFRCSSITNCVDIRSNTIDTTVVVLLCDDCKALARKQARSISVALLAQEQHTVCTM